MGLYHKLIRAVACMLIQDRKTMDLPEALVSFTFDDTPDSALLAGRAILKKYGYSGTYYVSMGLPSDQDSQKTYFNHALLPEVVREGGEIGCHTYDHIHLYVTPADELRKSLERNQEAIRKLIPGYTFRNFSYPYGEQSMSTKKVIRSVFKSARSVKTGLNTNPVDFNNLRVVPLERDMNLNAVLQYIDQAIAQKAWIILYSHDIQDDCSEWGCTPAVFEEVVRHCSEHKLKGLTMEQAVGKA
jgi:peptidoglycan/xylan/chitin deacetylase (PgdA/CDA1 family)